MKEFKRYMLTAALPYANGPVHIGHMAGVYLPADIYARYLRAKKLDVKFVSGSDEHGVPITIRAMKEGVSPKEIVDKYHAIIKDSFEQMGISFDIYSRTSNEVHHKTAQDFFLNLYNKGLFEERESEQYFDEEKQMFLADRYIVGTCPVCGNSNAYGDQCENCGTSLSPEQLINPRSVLSDAVPVKKKTKHWYFPLQDYENFLRQWILEDHKEWKNNVYGQCKSWLDKGLQPRAMTRDSNWGVTVPLPDAEGKVLYVWFDAPIGYISATKELTDRWKDYWCSEDTKLVHFIGKDNIVFHCIIFPSMLEAHKDFVLPENVPANEFLNIEGQKDSRLRQGPGRLRRLVLTRQYSLFALPPGGSSGRVWQGVGAEAGRFGRALQQRRDAAPARALSGGGCGAWRGAGAKSTLRAGHAGPRHHRIQICAA